MVEKNKEFKIVRRVDKLPIDVRIKLENKAIYDGLIVYEGTINSPKEIKNEKQAYKLPSQLLEEAFNQK